MNFKEAIEATLDKKYVQMLSPLPPMPYTTKKPQVDDLQAYQSNNERYHNRLEEERVQFNEAYETVRDRQNARMKKRNIAKNKRACGHLKRIQVLKTLIFFLPILITAVAGWDIFKNSHGILDKIKAIPGMSFDMIIAIFVLYCLVIFVAACILISKTKASTKKMCGSLVEERKKGNPVDKKAVRKTARCCNFWVFIALILSAAILWTNLSNIALNIGKDKLTFIVGDNETIEYVKKDSAIELPVGEKSDVSRKDEESGGSYIVKYTFVGWNIDGEMYYSGEMYNPNGRQKAEAVFTESEWCVLSISSAGYKRYGVSAEDLMISYSGGMNSGEETCTIPRGSTVMISAYNPELTIFNKYYRLTSFDIDTGRSSYSIPCTFTINSNKSLTLQCIV